MFKKLFGGSKEEPKPKEVKKEDPKEIIAKQTKVLDAKINEMENKVEKINNEIIFYRNVS